MSRKATCDCGVCRKCYCRIWAAKRRESLDFRKAEIAAVRRYQKTEKGKTTKRRSDRKYRQTHREEIAAKKRIRYHALSDDEKAFRNRRYRYAMDIQLLDSKCALCRSEDRLELDHKHPLVRGGTSVEDNLWTLCRSCNAFKKDRLVTAGEYPGVLL